MNMNKGIMYFIVSRIAMTGILGIGMCAEAPASSQGNEPPRTHVQSEYFQSARQVEQIYSNIFDGEWDITRTGLYEGCQELRSLDYLIESGVVGVTHDEQSTHLYHVKIVDCYGTSEGLEPYTIRLGKED